MKQKMSRREDYLKLIYTLSLKGQVRGSDLADELGIRRSTVCVYLKRLAEVGDVTMDAHHCVSLTAQGRAIAESTLDKHGLLLDLLQELGVPAEVANRDACAIEHDLSPETYGALKRLLLERQRKDLGEKGNNMGTLEF